MKPDTALKDFEPDSFDVITLWHVMEHLEPLNEVWETLNSLLTEKGVLIVAVPNCSSYDARKYGAYWAAYDVPRHLWHFTPGTIQQLGSKHGFILAERHPMPFDAFLYLHADREEHASFVPVCKRNDYRNIGMASCTGEERAQQLHDLCVS